MTQQEKLQLLEDLFEQDPGALAPETPLSNLHWDSMAKLSVVALVKENFDKSLNSAQIKSFMTIGDILDFME